MANGESFDKVIEAYELAYARALQIHGDHDSAMRHLRSALKYQGPRSMVGESPENLAKFLQWARQSGQDVMPLVQSQLRYAQVTDALTGVQ